MREQLPAWVIKSAEWAVLLPVWRKYIRAHDGRVAASIATAAVWLIAAASVISSVRDDEFRSNQGDTLVEASTPPEVTTRPRPSSTSTPTLSPSPSADGGGEATPVGPGGETLETPAPAPATGGPGEVPPASVLTVIGSTSYIDDGATLHVAGEVRNNGADFLEFVEITGVFFNAAGEIITSDYTYTHADFVGPAETAGFDLPIDNGANLGVARYELTVAGQPSAERPAAGLVIQSESASVDGGGDYHVTGTVVNQSGAAVEFVKVIGTFFGPDGTIVRSDFTYTDLDEIPPGGTDSFDLIVAAGGSAGIATYTLKVEGFPV
jgi:hypothetical protein